MAARLVETGTGSSGFQPVHVLPMCLVFTQGLRTAAVQFSLGICCTDSTLTDASKQITTLLLLLLHCSIKRTGARG
jgi:hypothetical protein